jgi:hypothetical protein
LFKTWYRAGVAEAFAESAPEAGEVLLGEAQAQARPGRSATRKRLRFFMARILMNLQALKRF